MEENLSMGVNEVQTTEPMESAANSQIETQITEPQQESVQQPQQNEGFEKAFAARLAHEREKIAQEYEQQYTPYKSVLEKAASQYNMTVDQYLNALQEQEQEAERQRYIEQGVNPDLVNQLIEKNPIYQKAQSIVQERENEARFNQEAQELFGAFPDLKAEDVPREVFDLRNQTGMPLIMAYKATMFDKVKQSTEQETIKKLQNNATTSPGALGQEGTSHNTNIKSMSSKDFASLVEKVKRGEIQNL